MTRLSLHTMPTAETSETVQLSAKKDFYPLPPGTPIPSDEAVMEELERRYEDLQSGKSRGLTWEEYQLFDRLDELEDCRPLSDEEIIEEADRRYEELRSGKVQGLTLEEHFLATR